MKVYTAVLCKKKGVQQALKGLDWGVRFKAWGLHLSMKNPLPSVLQWDFSALEQL